MVSSLVIRQATMWLGLFQQIKSMTLDFCRFLKPQQFCFERVMNISRAFCCNEIYSHIRILKQELRTLRLENECLRDNCAHLIEKNQRLTYEVSHDSLTGLHSRKYFDVYGEQACQKATLIGSSLALLVIDIDHFKHFNDTYSHQTGDQLLQLLGLCLRAAVKAPGSWIARYGGEEFVVVLPEHDQLAALAIAQRIHRVVRVLGITVSIGIACHAKDGNTALNLFRCADLRMYTAKRNGRNRIEMS